jgi:pyruvate dehydrogenase E2 component (dihydrolipoamide acetyltransferase)
MYAFKLPDLGEGIQEGELLEWHVKEGDAVQEDDPLCDLETDKAAVTIPSPKSGTVQRLGARVGAMVQVGQVLVEIQTAEDADPPAKEASRAGDRSKSSGDAERVARAIAAPAVRRMAREMDIDINQVSGTGPWGRVTAEDLAAVDRQPDTDKSEKASETATTSDETVQVSGIPFLVTAPLPDFSDQGPVKTVPIRSLRRKTADKTVTSSILVPHVAHMDEIDVTELEKLRQAYNNQPKLRLGTDPEFEKEPATPASLTLLAFVIKAVSHLLKSYPAFNASVDPDRMQIIQKQFYHIGFAADTPRGLVVPVIRDADRLGTAALGYRIRHLARAAREGTITREDLTGGTFSVTNVGAIGGTHVVPVINYPETAILGLGRMEKKPVVRNDEIVIRQMLPLTLCFDHRVADGAQAARFMKDLKAMMEDPVVFATHT